MIGEMVYYSSSTCGYDSSEEKYVIDTWSKDKLNISDLTNYLGYKMKNEGTIFLLSDGNTLNWVYGGNYVWKISFNYKWCGYNNINKKKGKF